MFRYRYERILFIKYQKQNIFVTPFVQNVCSIIAVISNIADIEMHFTSSRCICFQIIAFCVARGQPAPKVSFSVNFVSYSKIEKRPLLEVESTIQHSTVSRYSQKGGLNVNKWFEYKAERCPKPEYFSQTSVQEHHDVTKTMIAVKPLPYLSRHQVRVLYCTAEGYDNVYTTTKVTSKVFGKMKMFMKAAKAVSFMYAFG
jgi:hypothetical protein